MQLLGLSLRNFRNYERADLEFGSGLNILFGDNAQGKSNLLEAIYLAITGRSFRTRALSDLIRHGSSSFFVELQFTKRNLPQTLSIGYDGNERRIVHNGRASGAFTDLLGLLQGVMLAPEDRQLVAGAPMGRRRFLDLHLAQLDPLYVHHLARYSRALRQRNQLLRRGDEATLAVWEEQLVSAGAYITQRRTKAIEELTTPLTTAYQSLAPSDPPLTLAYRTSVASLESYSRNRARERIVGHTFSGPHRDDLDLSIGDRPARLFGSEGQKSSCAIALRLAEWQRLHRQSGEKPLMLVDDIAAQLDEERKRCLRAQLQGCGQSFLATPHLPERPEATLFKVVAGEAFAAHPGETTHSVIGPGQLPLHREENVPTIHG